MKGHDSLRVPANGRDLAAQTDAMRGHHMEMRQQDLVIATMIRRNSKLRSMVGQTVAYRMSRQYVHAAGLNLELAKAYRRADDLYREGRAKKAARGAGWSD
jgi:hypothetical protein